MAREWSRRSIEEIARKIGKGLGGENFIDLWTGGYPYTTADFHVYNSESQKYESRDGVLVRPFLTLKGIRPSFVGEPYIDPDSESIFLCYLPYNLRLNLKDGFPWSYEVDFNWNSGDFLPFITNSSGVVRNNANYYVAIVNNPAKNATPTRIVNFDNYTRDELDIYRRVHSAVVDSNNPIQSMMDCVSLWLGGSKAQEVYNYFTDLEASPILTVYKKDGV
jgi:hypothetical protein